MDSANKFQDFTKDLLAGGASGIAAKCISAPIERVKLLLQTQSVNPQIKSNSTPYKGALDCVKRVYTEQGVWSFWRGNVANVTRYFPSQAINFAMKDQYKKVFSVDATRSPTLAHMANLVSGGMAGATSLTFIYPLDVARTRLAADVGDNKAIQRKFSSTLGCLSEVYKANGVRGLYSGYGAALGGVVVFRSLYLGGYDSVKQHFDLNSKPLLVKYFAAQVLTTVVGTLCYPLDTIRRKMMMQAESGHGERLYSSGLDCARKVLRSEGLRGFYPGIGVNVARGVSGALLLIGYDEIKAILHS